MTEKKLSSVRLITENQLADIFQISVRTIQSWRYAGTGPKYIKIGKSVRYRLFDVKEFLQQNEVETQIIIEDTGEWK